VGGGDVWILYITCHDYVFLTAGSEGAWRHLHWACARDGSGSGAGEREREIAGHPAVRLLRLCCTISRRRGSDRHSTSASAWRGGEELVALRCVALGMGGSMQGKKFMMTMTMQ